MCPEMKGGKFGSVGAVTLEKGKLDMTQKKVESTPEVSLSLLVTNQRVLERFSEFYIKALLSCSVLSLVNSI